MPLLDQLRQWARRIKTDAVALWFAKNHPQTPWYAKALGAFVVAYALSPIDLIPDFIPVLGYVDDLLLLPALIWLTVRLIPTEVLEQSRLQAAEWLRQAHDRPKAIGGAIMVVAIWLVVGLLLLWKFSAFFSR
ncbi:YkvA family protein [Rhodoferax sp.]|uniref:YkvA family protein n=1 Tax=Rhodoferax sp. TaxID=50421 RepID=UPI0026158915|nr:YkvA family protein [Rhodoferax sp.]MDD2925477.1 YkvA family protein [Rhodoferax sp.]